MRELLWYYHQPIAWGGPLICLGALCFGYGEILGTHPNCFVSWENGPIAGFFGYNFVTFLLTIGFQVIILFNVVRVQSHNKETVMYLKDQVKGLQVTSLLMILLWSVPSLGYLSYFKVSPHAGFWLVENFWLVRMRPLTWPTPLHCSTSSMDGLV